MFKRVVDAVEWVVLAGAVVTFVLLFAYRPGTGTGAASGNASANGPTPATPQLAAGQKVYLANCVQCHGASGEGGIGAKLRFGAVVTRYPNVEDEVTVVTEGKGSMPAWSGRLTPEEIDAVVAWTREGLR